MWAGHTLIKAQFPNDMWWPMCEAMESINTERWGGYVGYSLTWDQ